MVDSAEPAFRYYPHGIEVRCDLRLLSSDHYLYYLTSADLSLSERLQDAARVSTRRPQTFAKPPCADGNTDEVSTATFIMFSETYMLLGIALTP